MKMKNPLLLPFCLSIAFLAGHLALTGDARADDNNGVYFQVSEVPQCGVETRARYACDEQSNYIPIPNSGISATYCSHSVELKVEYTREVGFVRTQTLIMDDDETGHCHAGYAAVWNIVPGALGNDCLLQKKLLPNCKYCAYDGGDCAK